MRNPWLSIPLSDYEGHMALPEVDQARMLSDEFAALLQQHRPRSLAVIGCAGGNGFDRIDPRQTQRVIGVELNPDYLATLRSRFAGIYPSLELICADVQRSELEFAPVELIFAGLVLEYVDPAIALRNLARRLQPGGTLAVILQLPASAKASVTATQFTSLQQLAVIMQLIAPEEAIAAARAAGLSLSDTRRVVLHTGKTFQLLQFASEL
jgi:SAM-dependent methyltransferase